MNVKVSVKRKVIKAMRKVLDEYGWSLDDSVEYICTKCENVESTLYRTVNYCSLCGGKMKKKRQQKSGTDVQLWDAFTAAIEEWEE